MAKNALIGKTIEEIFTGYDIKIRLGAKNGCCFIYCGNTSDIDGDHLDEIILGSYKRTLVNLNRKITKLTNVLKRNNKDIDIAKIKSDIAKSKEKRRRIKQKIDSYATIRDKIILDCYNSIDEEDTLILIYDGKDRGFAWTTEDFQKGVDDDSE